MAQPGEFFPQQFAMGVLQLAQAQKQFNARLREQRSTAAARNFLEKQRLELAERQQRFQEQQAGPRRPPAEFGQIDAFRQRSAEGAMNVRDQLALMQGQRQLERQKELEARVDGALPAKIFSDFTTHGRAFVPTHHLDLIPSIRKHLGLGGPPGKEEVSVGKGGELTTTGKVTTGGGTGMQEEVTTGKGGALTTTGRVTGGRGRTGEAAAPEAAYDLVEIPTKGGTLLIRVGGQTLEQQKQAADIAKSRAEVARINADTAKIKLETEVGAATKEFRIAKAEKEARAVGSLDGDKFFSNYMRYIGFAERIISAQLEPLVAEQSSLEKTMLAPSLPGFAEKKQRLAEVTARIKELQSALATNPASWLEQKSEEFKELGASIGIAGRVAQITQTQKFSGKLQAPDPDIKGDAGVQAVLQQPLPDRLKELALKPDSKINPKEIWKNLPASLTIPFKHNGKIAPALFHVDPDGSGLVPLNKVAYGLADQMEKSVKSGEAARLPGFARPPALNPSWRLIGWNAETAGDVLGPAWMPGMQVATTAEMDRFREQQSATEKRLARNAQLRQEAEAALQNLERARAAGEDTEAIKQRLNEITKQLTEKQ